MAIDWLAALAVCVCGVGGDGAGAGSPTGSPTPGTLFVSGYSAHAVFRYDAVSGAFLGTLDATGGILGPLGLTIGPDDALYVASEINDRVLRFDPETGVFLGVFVAAGVGGLNEPAAVVFGPDANDDGASDLYVSSFIGDRVLLFDGTNGASLGIFVLPGAGNLNGPDAGMTFGPDGDLYVPSFWNSRVNRYDGATGAFVTTTVPAASGGLTWPRTILFPPGGEMLVSAEGSNRVNRYDATTGAFIQTIIEVRSPTGLTYDDAGFLYVASLGDDAVYRYDASGAIVDTVVPAGTGGLDTPTFVLLMPDTPCPTDVDGDGTVGFGDVVDLLAAWGPCAGCPADVDGDGVVGFVDLVTVLAQWGVCP